MARRGGTHVRRFQRLTVQKVEEIAKTFPDNPCYQRLIDYWPGSLHWKDPLRTNEGSVFIFEALGMDLLLCILNLTGRADPSMIDSIGVDNLLQFHIYSMENLERIYFETVAEKGYGLPIIPLIQQVLARICHGGRFGRNGNAHLQFSSYEGILVYG